jgi:hypothetical protein
VSQTVSLSSLTGSEMETHWGFVADKEWKKSPSNAWQWWQKLGLRKAVIESILGTLLSLYVSCGQGDAGCSL